MGTTFVTLSDSVCDDDPGFWMRDGILELWLRLLSLHLPDPTPDNELEAATIRSIRDTWLLASRGYFGGHVPHGLETAVATPFGCDSVRSAINSLMTALSKSEEPLVSATFNLLGFDGTASAEIERAALLDVGRAFLDLLDGRIVETARSTDVMPGSKPYNGG